MAYETVDLDPFPSHSGTQMDLFGVKGKPDRLVRVPKLTIDSNWKPEPEILAALQREIGEFLPNPEIVRAYVRGAAMDLVSVQKIETPSMHEHPMSILKRHARQKNLPLEGLDRFVDGSKRLHVTDDFLPDLAGRGNFIIWNGKPLLLDFNSHYDHLEQIDSRPNHHLEIAVNREGVPTRDLSIAAMAFAETEILHRDTSTDNYYEVLRDSVRQEAVKTLMRRYMNRISLEKMC